VSVIDANFRLGSIQQPAGTATTSPFFKAPPGAAQTARTVDLSPSSTAVTVLPAYQIMIHPLKGVHSVLHRFCPEYVLLFDPDIGVIRELEMFQAMPSTDWQLHVYFMLYSNSIGEKLRAIASAGDRVRAAHFALCLMIFSASDCASFFVFQRSSAT